MFTFIRIYCLQKHSDQILAVTSMVPSLRISYYSYFFFNFSLRATDL